MKYTVVDVWDGLVSPRRDQMMYRSDVREITIHEGIQQIGDECSRFFPNVEKVKLPKSLKVIGDKAFNGCNKLGKLVIPEGVMCIGRFAFVGCAFEKLNVPHRLEEYYSDMFACNSVKYIKMCQKSLSEILESNIEAVFGGTNISTIEVDGEKYDAERYFHEYCLNSVDSDKYFDVSVKVFWGSPFALQLAKVRVAYENSPKESA